MSSPFFSLLLVWRSFCDFKSNTTRRIQIHARFWNHSLDLPGFLIHAHPCMQLPSLLVRRAAAFPLSVTIPKLGPQEGRKQTKSWTSDCGGAMNSIHSARIRHPPVFHPDRAELWGRISLRGGASLTWGLYSSQDRASDECVLC